MNIQESINRGFNLLAVSIVSLAGFAFLPETFVENDIPDKIDDILLFIIGIIAMIWYRKSNNRYIHSVLPVVFIIVSLAVKACGLIIEIDDPEAFGDDIGGLILFVLGTGLILKQYASIKKFSQPQHIDTLHN